MGHFIVIEGLDGSGKSTQLTLLQKYLSENNIPYNYLHFPRLETGIFGRLIARFLRGEFGNVDEVDPYLVALLYAGDRKDASEQINTWLSEDNLVVLDRYMHSNIAYQCAKYNDEEKIKILRAWIFELEYNYYKIPEPDLSIFLHVPFEFVAARLNDARDGTERDYLKGKQDIHESNLVFQKNVEREYLRLTKSEKNYILVPCHDQKGKMLSAVEINKKIIDLLIEKKII